MVHYLAKQPRAGAVVGSVRILAPIDILAIKVEKRRIWKELHGISDKELTKNQ